MKIQNLLGLVVIAVDRSFILEKYKSPMTRGKFDTFVFREKTIIRTEVPFSINLKEYNPIDINSESLRNLFRIKQARLVSVRYMRKSKPHQLAKIIFS